jgi:hypothetical protein
MATSYGLQMNKLRNQRPQILPDVGDVGGRVRCFNEKILLSGQAIGDVIEAGLLPRGARLLYGVLNSDTSLGTSTLAVGINGVPNKYMVPDTLTNANIPMLFGRTLSVGEPLIMDELLLITVGTAALPVGGVLRLQLFYTLD